MKMGAVDVEDKNLGLTFQQKYKKRKNLSHSILCQKEVLWLFTNYISQDGWIMLHKEQSPTTRPVVHRRVQMMSIPDWQIAVATQSLGHQVPPLPELDSCWVFHLLVV